MDQAAPLAVVDLPDLPLLRPGRYRLREYTLDESDAIFRSACKHWGRPIADALVGALGSFFLAMEEPADPDLPDEQRFAAAAGAAISRLAESYQVGHVLTAVGASGVAAMFRDCARGHLLRVEGGDDGDPERVVDVLPAAAAAAAAFEKTPGGPNRYYSGGAGMHDAAVLLLAMLAEVFGPLARALATRGPSLLRGLAGSRTPATPET
jgi:hypothetical protein